VARSHPVRGRRRVLSAIGLLMLASVLAIVTGAFGGSQSGPSRRLPRRPRRASRAVANRVSSVSPRCTPSTLNRSAVLAGTPLSVSPLPGTMVAEPSSQISLLGVPVGAIAAVSVTGSHTGHHEGRLIGYSQGDGASYVLQRPFSAGEHVTVRGTLHLASGSRPFAFAFTVADEDPLPDRTMKYSITTSPTGIQRFHGRPDLAAPTVRISTPAASSVAPGDIFVAAYATANGPGGPMIFENSGQLVWFKALAKKVSATNLQVQQYWGRPVLTWWQGTILPQGFGEGEEVIDNTAYQQIAVVHAANGLLADLHDFQITSQNTGLLTAYDPVHCDLASIGGPRDGDITDAVYQEIDLQTGLVRREWHALDHVAIADTYAKVNAGDARTAFPFDFFHINTLDPLPNGTLMLSSRNTWTIYTVDDHTGEVLARIGGKRSTVKMGPGTRTAWQHDTLALPDGDITVFDNGAIPKVHPYSRGIVERLDPATNTMKLVREYTHSPPLSAATQGNLQTLANGNVLLGWGAEPYVSEYSPSGQPLFEARIATAGQSYRAFRFPWTGQPASSPTLAIAPGKTHSSKVAYASWNGATQVASWRVLAGATKQRLSPVSTVTRSGFETTIPLASVGPWFAVQALDHSGDVVGSSVASQAR
jgi:Arylsulfotransferase (ASST)